jgi:hypothetical protein
MIMLMIFVLLCRGSIRFANDDVVYEAVVTAIVQSIRIIQGEPLYVRNFFHPPRELVLLAPSPI